MKILAALLITLTFNTFAQTRLSEQDQLNVVESYAKDIRRNLWQGGYENVSTHVVKVSARLLAETFEQNDQFASPLDTQTMSKLTQCLADKKNCSLFLIGVSCGQYGGDGSYYVWVLMNPKDVSFETIEHTVYEE